MPDNTLLNIGLGGDTIATDDLATINQAATSGVKVERTKVGYGYDSAFSDVNEGNPLPVKDTQLYDILNNIFVELRVMNKILHSTLNARDDLDDMRDDENNTTIQIT